MELRAANDFYCMIMKHKLIKEGKKYIVVHIIDKAKMETVVQCVKTKTENVTSSVYWKPVDCNRQ